MKKSRGLKTALLASQGLYERTVSCVEACFAIKSLRKLHACIVTRGLSDQIHLAFKLSIRYASIGEISESRSVLNRIAIKGPRFWDSVIVGYFRGGQFEEACWLYSNLKLRGVGVNSSSITFTLKSCSETGDIEFGRGIHVDAYKAGLNVGKFVGSSLVGLYSRCGSIEDAQRAFEETLDKDVVVYTALVTAYARLSDSRACKAFEIARDMLGEIHVNRVTLVSLLQAAGQLEALKEGRSIHCYAITRGIGLSDEVLETSLVGMYARCGAATEAVSMLRQSNKKVVASWNAIMAGLIHHGRSHEALKCFNVMQQEAHVLPDLVTIANVLTACSVLSYVCQAQIIHCYLFRREITIDLVVSTVLIDLYSKSHKIKYARELFDRLVVKDFLLYNAMISGYLQNGEVDEAIKILSNMVKEDAKPNSVTMLSLLSTFSETSDIRKGSWIHGFILRFGLHSDVNVTNQILYMYAKCRLINRAEKIFKSIIQKDLVSWTAMIMGYIDSGHAEKALLLFKLMQESSVRPDSVTIVTILEAVIQVGCLGNIKEIHGYSYRIWFARDIDSWSSLITAYAKCGMLDTAKAVFSSMPEKGLSSWNTMITAYGLHGFYREMFEVFHQMQRENIIPDEVTFTSLLSSCSHVGLVEEGWRIFCSMNSEYLIAPQEEHYGCMVDLLGRAGQLEQASDFVKSSPFANRTSLLRALLAACRIHGNTMLGEAIGSQLVDIDPRDSGAYTLVSNIYAEASKWIEYVSLRNLAIEEGLRKVPGYSRI